jgi:hypothetical protein
LSSSVCGEIMSFRMPLSATISISAATDESGAVIRTPSYSRSSEKASDSNRSIASDSGASSWPLKFEWLWLTSSVLSQSSCTSTLRSSPSSPSNSKYRVARQPSNPSVDCGCTHNLEASGPTSVRFLVTAVPLPWWWQWLVIGNGWQWQRTVARCVNSMDCVLCNSVMLVIRTERERVFVLSQFISSLYLFLLLLNS